MTRIYFNRITIGNVSESSGIFQGTNIQENWSYSEKCNEGFGFVATGNQVENGHHIVRDQDTVETN
jgi:hypothetical protein